MTCIPMNHPRNVMPLSNPDNSLLLIRCPTCGQKFKVGEDLRDRTVECGGCEHRFRIGDDVIIRGRKIYPGERSGADLNRFHRVPLASGERTGDIQPARYGNQPDPAVLEPMSPQRIIAGIVGVTGIVFMALLLMFGGVRGGMLDGMILSKRLMMAGFASVLGTAFLFYANPKARWKALAVGLLLSAGVMAVPFWFRAGTDAMPTGKTGIATAPEEEAVEPRSEMEKLRTKIGTGPLDLEIKRLAETGSAKHAAGLWLRGLSERNRYLIMDYILRVTGADLATHYYPRDHEDFLLVVTGIDASLDELAKSAAALGEVLNIYPELSIVEVKVENDRFLEGSIEKLANKDDPAFYELNKRELESIDLSRVKRAVQRLAEAEPKIYRVDVSRKLIELLGQNGVDFKPNVCTALMSWSDKPGPAGAAALAAVRKLVEANEPVSQEMIELIVKEKNTDVIPVLTELWFRDPAEWEQLFGELGPPIEPAVLARFDATQGLVRYSAVRLLGRVGGAASLPILDSMEGRRDPELQVLVAKARDAIQARIGK